MTSIQVYEKKIIEYPKIKTIELSNQLVSALLELADMKNYDFHVLMGAEFKGNEDHSSVVATALYNPVVARFAQPISINLVSNAILRNVSDDEHSIEISAQQLPKMQENNSNGEIIMAVALIYAYAIAGLFAFLIYPAVALFIIHPVRESMTNVKHLQRMTGASCFSYWGSMFLFDLLVFFVMSLVFVIGLVIADFIFDLGMFGFKEVGKYTEWNKCSDCNRILINFFPLILAIELGLFTLFGANVLPLVYIFSFWKKSTAASIKLLSLLPIALGKVSFSE